MQFSKTVFFTNYSQEDFTYNFDGVSYTFLKGKTYQDLPEGVALHFARHLAKRELGRIKDFIFNEQQIDKESQKALPNNSIDELKEKEFSIEWEKGTEPKKQETGSFAQVPQAFPDTPVKEADAIPRNVLPTDSEVQAQGLPQETNVRDNKEMPKKKMGRPKKVTTDAEYTK